MNLPESIDLNKSALARIVAGLFVQLGWTAGTVLGRIPRDLHRAIIRVLLPAESAVRRLIVVLASSIKVKARPPRPQPAGLVRAGLVRAGLVRAGLVRASLVRAGRGKQRFSFPLFDPRQRFFRKPRRPKNEPRARPSIAFFRDGEYRRISFGREPPPPSDGLETSAHIARRLAALKAALENLPQQAMRLARVLARRQTSERLKFKAPLRPGPAPGSRKQPVQEIHRVLERCHWLAREAQALAVSRAPDSS